MPTTTYWCRHCHGQQPPAGERAGEEPVMLQCAVCGDVLDRRRAAVAGIPLLQPTILLVVDDAALRKKFESWALRAHLVPVVAPDSGSSLPLALGADPSAILLVSRDSGTATLALCRRLRLEPALKQTVILVLTPQPDPRLRVQAFQAGATLAMTEPPHLDDLLPTIHLLLTFHRAPGPVLAEEPERSARF